MKKRKKRKLKPITPRSRVTNALRMLWLRSRERSEALKINDRRCNVCGVRESHAKGNEKKIQVHHKEGINVWQEIIDLVFKKILVSPDRLECMCPECHKKEHEKEWEKFNKSPKNRLMPLTKSFKVKLKIKEIKKGKPIYSDSDEV